MMHNYFFSRSWRLQKEGCPIGVILRLNSQILYRNHTKEPIKIKHRVSKCNYYYLCATINPALDVPMCGISYPEGCLADSNLKQVWNHNEGVVLKKMLYVTGSHRFRAFALVRLKSIYITVSSLTLQRPTGTAIPQVVTLFL